MPAPRTQTSPRRFREFPAELGEMPRPAGRPGFRRTLQVLTALAVLVAPLIAQAASPRTRDLGRSLYEERCVLCHGAEGQGWDWGPKVLRPPIPVPNLASVVPKRSDSYLQDIIKGGGPAVGLTSFMPAAGFNLTDEEIRKLVGYLRGLSGVSGNPRSAWNSPRKKGENGLFRLAGWRAAPVGLSLWRSGSFPRTGAPFRLSPGAKPDKPEGTLRTYQHGDAKKRGHYRTGFFPHAVALADFNRDGNIDLAIPASAERKITLLLGDGKGGILSNHSYPVARGPTWIAASDFNGDGNLDLITTNSGAGSLTLYFGDGKGDFGRRTDIPGVRGAACVVVADFNGDGRPDLAVTQAGDARIALLINDASGIPKLKGTIPTERGPHIMDQVDLNGDGRPDLVVGSLGSHTLSVLLGKGEGTFSDPIVIPVGRFPHYRVYADFNGDGHLDGAVVSGGEDLVQILLGDGTGRLTLTQSYRVGTNPHGLASSDFNGDGHLDLVVGNRTSLDAMVLLGDGKGNFIRTPPLKIGQDVISVAGEDFDRDGNSDIAVISASSHVVMFFQGDGKGSFRPMTTSR